jgi:hypothetical protein
MVAGCRELDPFFREVDQVNLDDRITDALRVLGVWRQMALKIHRVVENSEYLDHVLVLVPSSSEDHKVTTSSSVACDVYGRDCAPDFRAFSRTRNCRSIGKGLQG